MLVSSKTKWNKTYDVVVLGLGMAGAAAALTAHDKGASVVVLEKQSAATHCTCSSISGGLFVSSKDAKGATTYMEALNKVDDRLKWSDSESIRVLAKYSAENADWIQGLGGKAAFVANFAEHPQLPGSASMQLWEYRGKGLRMMEFMYEQVKARGIEVLYETPASRLLTDTDGKVLGVRAAAAGGEINIRAAGAVILCTGGFESNEEMKLQFLRVYPAWFTGGADNTGDGIKMAMEVGADLWHMNCVSARMVLKTDDFPVAFSIGFGGKNWNRRRLEGKKERAEAGFIFTDKYGRRFTNEDIKGHALYYELTQFDTHRLEYPRVPGYFIFDQRRMDAGAMVTTGLSGPHQFHKWSQDNLAELGKGWIVSGKTPKELARKIGVEPAVLADTVERYNRFCADQNDADFGRNPLELVALDSPSYYAMRLLPGGPNTQGGPRRNSRAQVLNVFGKPIPGLYAAGECGSVYGMLYPVAGGNLAECIAFGRISGENAAKEKAAV